jgi:hypothetical protein
MGCNRLVIVGATLLLGGCAAAPTRTPDPRPESAEPPATIAAEPPAIESAEPPEVVAANPDQHTNGTDAGKYGAGKGETIVTAAMQISSSNTQGSATQSVAGQFGGGYFLTDEHEVGGQLLIDYIAPPGPNAVLVFLAPYYNYNYYVNPRLSVYGGPHMGYARFSAAGDDTNSFQYGAQAGARYWLEPKTAAYAEWRFTHYQAFGEGTNDFTLLLGLAFTF